MEPTLIAAATGTGATHGGDAGPASPLAAAGAGRPPNADQGVEVFPGEFVSVAGILARFNPDTGEFEDEPVKTTGR
jgi:hypothetical protein